MGSSWDVFSGDQEECPNCECKIKDTFLYECKDTFLTGIVSDAGRVLGGDEMTHCGKKYCAECGTFLHNCPTCGSIGTITGRIDPESDEDTEGASADEDPDDDSSASDYTPSEYIAPSSSDYIPPSTVKKEKEGSFIWVLMVLALFLGWGFHLSKTDEPQKVATSSTAPALKDPTFNTPGKADESDNENTTHVVTVLPLTLLGSTSLPSGVSGVVLDVRHDFPILGEQALGARIFVGLDDQKSFSITSHYDMDLERGDWVHIVSRGDGRVEVIKLGDSPEALGMLPDAKSEDTIVDAPLLPPGVDGIVLDIEHDYPIAGRQELGAHIFVELSSGENVFITLFHDINLERKDKVRVATQDDGSVEVVKLPTE